MIIMEFNQLKKNLKKDFTGLPVIKIAVLGDSATQLLCQALKGYSYTQGIHLDIWEADYNQVYQTVSDEHSLLYSSTHDYVIIFQSSKKLLSNFYKKNTGQKRKFAEEQLAFVEKITDTINSRIKCTIIYLNYPEINDAVFGNFGNKLDISFLYQLRLMNVELMKLAQRKKNVNICDLSAIQNILGSKITVSEKFYITTDNVLELDVLPVVAKQITDIILAYSGRFKKCLVLDLDNTMWGGIIGDDGIEGIEIGDLGIGKAFTKLQQWVKQLKERGIILAVCSKNTEHLAKEPFEKHPDMILRLEDIAVFVANWENKVDNIRYIQSILNIGFDSMVFLDDSPFEREMVRKGIPEMTVPDLPEDPAEYLPFLYEQNLFETTSFTEEDNKRNDQYREEAERTVMQHAFTNQDEFLQSLLMTAVIQPINTFTLPRAAQLTQRSNQFNVRTIRYTEEQVKIIIADKNKYTLTVSLQDKFGDYGLISLVIAEKKTDTDMFIDTWIMSCRVLKRKVEQFVLNEIVTLARKHNFKRIVGEYIPTPKNGLVKDHFKTLGFANEKEQWVLTVDNYTDKTTFINKQ